MNESNETIGQPDPETSALEKAYRRTVALKLLREELRHEGFSRENLEDQVKLAFRYADRFIIYSKLSDLAVLEGMPARDDGGEIITTEKPTFPDGAVVKDEGGGVLKWLGTGLLIIIVFAFGAISFKAWKRAKERAPDWIIIDNAPLTNSTPQRFRWVPNGNEWKAEPVEPSKINSTMI